MSNIKFQVSTTSFCIPILLPISPFSIRHHHTSSNITILRYSYLSSFLLPLHTTRLPPHASLFIQLLILQRTTSPASYFLLPHPTSYNVLPLLSPYAAFYFLLPYPTPYNVLPLLSPYAASYFLLPHPTPYNVLPLLSSDAASYFLLPHPTPYNVLPLLSPYAASYFLLPYPTPYNVLPLLSPYAASYFLLPHPTPYNVLPLLSSDAASYFLLPHPTPYNVLPLLSPSAASYFLLPHPTPYNVVPLLSPSAASYFLLPHPTSPYFILVFNPLIASLHDISFLIKPVHSTTFFQYTYKIFLGIVISMSPLKIKTVLVFKVSDLIVNRFTYYTVLKLGNVTSLIQCRSARTSLSCNRRSIGR